MGKSNQAAHVQVLTPDFLGRTHRAAGHRFAQLLAITYLLAKAPGSSRGSERLRLRLEVAALYVVQFTRLALENNGAFVARDLQE